MPVLIDGLTFEYDGAVDSVSPCPICSTHMSWMQVGYFDPLFMECEECGILCNVETERVFRIEIDAEDTQPHDISMAEELLPSRA